MADLENVLEAKKRKGKWRADNMRKAVEAVLFNNMSARQAADRYQIPRTTLNDRLNAVKNNKKVVFKTEMGRFQNTFTPELENVLKERVKDLKNRLMPLNRQEFLRLAFQLAERLELPHQFNKEKKAAGKKYYYAFVKRHGDLSLQTLESTNQMKDTMVNNQRVNQFFVSLGNLMQNFHFTPDRIWNCDEIGLSIGEESARFMATINQRRSAKYLSVKADSGKGVTVLFAMSADGQFIPPLFVFPRTRINERLMINAPHDSICATQQSGWINAEIVVKWLHHFVKYSKPTEQQPVLLVLDGHGCHKDWDVIEFCSKNHIQMLSTPAHTAHKLQPLNRTFMKPFKSAYMDMCELWGRVNPGAKISEYEIAGFVGAAFRQVSRTDVAINGFGLTGIYPFNSDIVNNSDSLVSDISSSAESQEAVFKPTSSTSRQSDLVKVDSQLVNKITASDPRQLVYQTTSFQRSEPPIAGFDSKTKISTFLQSKVDVDQRRDNSVGIVPKLSPDLDALGEKANVRPGKGERYKKMMEERNAEKRSYISVKRGKNSASGKDVNKSGKRSLPGKYAVKNSKKKKKENQSPPRASDEEGELCSLWFESHEEDYTQYGPCKEEASTSFELAMDPLGDPNNETTISMPNHAYSPISIEDIPIIKTELITEPDQLQPEEQTEILDAAINSLNKAGTPNRSTISCNNSANSSNNSHSNDNSSNNKIGNKTYESQQKTVNDIRTREDLLKNIHEKAFKVLQSFLIDEIIDNENIYYFEDIYKKYLALLTESALETPKLSEKTFDDYKPHLLRNKIASVYNNSIAINVVHTVSSKAIVYKLGMSNDALIEKNIDKSSEQLQLQNFAYDVRIDVKKMEVEKRRESGVTNIVKEECIVPEKLRILMSALIKGPNYHQSLSSNDDLDITSLCESVICAISKKTS